MEDVVKEIGSYVNRLLQERAELKAQLSSKDEELQRLRDHISKQEAHITSIEESNKTLKIAKSLTGAGENTDAKLKINELVREIDKCIALLNK
jgi:chromosome segregation ATPase